MGFWTRNLCDGCRMLYYFNSHNPLASVFQLLECIKLNMVKNMWSFLGSIRTTQGTFQHHQFNSCMFSQIKPCHKILRGSNRNKVVYFHHILQIKVEKTSGKGVLGFIKKTFSLIHLKPPPPTLTLVYHIPIVNFMGMM
jgi:hypothetical protein